MSITRVQDRSAPYKYVLTVGCFDRLHRGHMIMLERLRKYGINLIVGIHDNESIEQIKGVSDIQSIQTRQKHLIQFAKNISTFIVRSPDPSSSIQSALTQILSKSECTVKDICFVRGNDNYEFPGVGVIRSHGIAIHYVPYDKSISTTTLRSYHEGINKVAILNRLLILTKQALTENKIDYYLDCGTLLGCIRDRAIMQHDTDADITVHQSIWNKLCNIDFKKYGMKTVRLQNHLHLMSLSLINAENKKFYIDIYGLPAFPKLKSTILNGVTYTIPVQPQLYIEMLYGKDWRIKSSKHADWKFHRYSGLVYSAYKVNWDPKYTLMKQNLAC